jgi:hypothetical protein
VKYKNRIKRLETRRKAWENLKLLGSKSDKQACFKMPGSFNK